MTTTRTPECMCLRCGYLMDAASSVDGGAGPKPGDWSLCMRCGTPLVFDAALRPVLPPPGAYDALQRTDPVVYGVLQRHRAAILLLARTHPIPYRRPPS